MLYDFGAPLNADGNDVLRLVYVQLVLTSGGVAEVEGVTWSTHFFLVGGPSGIPLGFMPCDVVKGFTAFAI